MITQMTNTIEKTQKNIKKHKKTQKKHKIRNNLSNLCQVPYTIVFLIPVGMFAGGYGAI